MKISRANFAIQKIGGGYSDNYIIVGRGMKIANVVSKIYRGNEVAIREMKKIISKYNKAVAK